MGNFVELTDAELVRNVSSFEEALATAERSLTDQTVKEEWQRRREAYMKTKVRSRHCVT